MYEVSLNKRIAWIGIFLIQGFYLVSAQTWDTIPMKLDWSPRIFYEDTINDLLYIGGNHTLVDSIQHPGIIQFDGQNYTFLDPGRIIPHPQIAITQYQNLLYVGGFRGLGYWDGQKWTIIDSTDLLVWSLSHYRDKLIVGGRFNSIDTFDLKELGVWDGTTWSDLFGFDSIIGGLGNAVTSVAVFQDEIYVAGNIDNLGPIDEITKWDGTNWTDVGGGIPGIGDELVEDMVEYKGELYVAGRFFENTGGPGNLIARWNGQRWDNVGGGMQGVQIFDLFVHQDFLWAVGNFHSVVGIPAQHIARWDGSRWCTLKSEFDNSIGNISSFRDSIYIGGGFWSIDGDSSFWRMAKLRDLYYSDTCSSIISTMISEEHLQSLNIFPNPVKSSLTLSYNPCQNGTIWKITILDSQGKSVLSKAGNSDCSSRVLNFELKNIPKGIYLMRFHIEGFHPIHKKISIR